ncbi:hypothetical protein quinque_016486, partial [Culex quinquefasciatus]
IFLGGLNTGLGTHEVAAAVFSGCTTPKQPPPLTGVAVVEPAADEVIFGFW